MTPFQESFLFLSPKTRELVLGLTFENNFFMQLILIYHPDVLKLHNHHFHILNYSTS